MKLGQQSVSRNKCIYGLYDYGNVPNECIKQTAKSAAAFAGSLAVGETADESK